MGDPLKFSRGPVPITKGEWRGWTFWRGDAFEAQSGPFYYRSDPDGRVRCAFRAEQKHMNGSQVVHGGCILTFADFSLFTFSLPHLGQDRTVTVSLTGDFAGSAHEGDLIESSGEVVKLGRSLIFLRGIIETQRRPIMNFSGILKRVRQET